MMGPDFGGHLDGKEVAAVLMTVVVCLICVGVLIGWLL